MATKKTSSKVLSMFMLTMINVAAIASLRSLPLAASYGFSIIFIYIAGALLFLIPSALVSAELATAFHETGGIFLWVEKAFGKKWGFQAIWMQFIENVIWVPTALSFAAATIAYLIDPALVQNKIYMVAMMFGIFWATTIINLLGMKASGWISSVGAIFGTIIPGALIILLGLIWWCIGRPIEISMTAANFLPKANIGNLVFTAGIVFSFAGMEMSAVHAKEVQNPNKNFPRAIFFSSMIIVLLFTLGSLAISFIIPKGEISLVAGLMDAFSLFFKSFNIPWFTPVLALSVAIGTMAQVSTWLIGPVKGIYATAEHGLLPKFFDKTNSKNVPYMVIFFQGLVVSALLVVFLIMPDINSSYWILAALATQLYLVMYLLMFAAAIYLRFTQPNLKRAYKVFGDNKIGICLVAGTGFIVSLLVFFLGFVPPDGVNTGSIIFYEGFLIIGLAVLCSVPFWAIKAKKND